jgi:hypothetical protein
VGRGGKGRAILNYLLRGLHCALFKYFKHDYGFETLRQLQFCSSTVIKHQALIFNVCHLLSSSVNSFPFTLIKHNHSDTELLVCHHYSVMGYFTFCNRQEG